MNTPSSESPLTPTSGMLTMQPADPNRPIGPISYWHTRTSEDQPPDFTGTIEEIREWIASNPPAVEPEAPGYVLAMDLAIPGSDFCVETLLDLSGPIDTSRLDSIPEPGWRAQQRQTAMRERPVVKQETWTSRKQRRALGDRRTAKQIVADIKRTGG